MQLARSNLFTQSNKTLDTVVKNTSCSHGWLRVVVQIIFGTITVASFIMILLMAMQRPPPPPTRCDVTNCRVRCSDVKLDEEKENDVINIVTETGLNCEKIVLTLRGLTFNNSTMPLHWMSRMPTNIHILNIVGGNLRHIPPAAFVGQFAGNIRGLSLEGITISQWMSTTFVGLSSLRRLFIKNCIFGDISRNALRAIDNTVRTLTVTHSGQWDPTFITGHMSSDNKLDTVDFSFNDFGSIIRSNTFKGLKPCKSLYLNSCRITSIAAGAFDSLVSVELLFLSNNLLHTVPAGLFESFLVTDRPKPRIHLENNPWICDCLQDDLIQMSKNGLLPVDTICTGPNYMLGKTIADLADHCRQSGRRATFGLELVFLTEKQPSLSKGALASLDRTCYYGDEPIINATFKIVSPIAHYQCQNTSFIHIMRKILRTGLRTTQDLSESDWLLPTFLLQNREYTAVQVSSSIRGNGILWYQTSCPNEVYCLSTIPNFLRVYNTVPDTQYTFCPFDLKTFEVPPHDCVKYSFSSTSETQRVYYKYVQNRPLLYLAIGITCVGLGAMCVYMIIRKNPTLLRGSKRLLFVKHRNVDALVLPPKVPLRNNNSFDDHICSMNDKIFTVPDGTSTLYVNHFVRSNSVRSDKSSTPTYISAMQPTEAQLAEWRIKHHFDKSPSIISISSDISTISWTSDRTSAEITTNVVYESLK